MEVGLAVSVKEGTVRVFEARSEVVWLGAWPAGPQQKWANDRDADEESYSGWSCPGPGAVR